PDVPLPLHRLARSHRRTPCLHPERSHPCSRIRRAQPQRALFCAGTQGGSDAGPLPPFLRRSQAVELQVRRCSLAEFLEPAASYLSIIELGLYESSLKLYRSLAERGIQPHSPEWNGEVEDTIARQREAMRPRLYPEIPGSRYLCFYPMDRRRGEDKNWYRLPMEERQRQMEEHGNVGRRYAGQVRQIITGSIGFDDWEWGVDLFADDP